MSFLRRRLTVGVSLVLVNEEGTPRPRTGGRSTGSGYNSEVYSYSNSGYVVLGYLIERLTKTTWEAALCELLLDPAGIEEIDVPYHRPLDAARVALYQRDDAGQLVRVEEIFPTWRSCAPCFSTLWGTARALVDLGRIFFNGVAPNGRRILSEAALAEMREPESAARSTLASAGLFQGLGWRGFDRRGHRVSPMVVAITTI